MEKRILTLLILPAMLAGCTTLERPKPEIGIANVEEEQQIYYDTIEQPVYPECEYSSAHRYAVVDGDGQPVMPWQDQMIIPLSKKVDTFDLLSLNEEARKLVSSLFVVTVKEQNQTLAQIDRNKHCLDWSEALFGTAKDSMIGLKNNKGEWLLELSSELLDEQQFWQKLGQLFPGQLDELIDIQSGERQKRLEKRVQALSPEQDNIRLSRFLGFSSAVIEKDTYPQQTLGLMDAKNGDWLISPQQMADKGYRVLDAWSSGLLEGMRIYEVDIKQEGGRVCKGLLDERGRETGIPLSAKPFHIDEKKLIRVEECNGSRKGLVNLKGEWVLEMPVEYHHLSISESPPDQEGWFQVSSQAISGEYLETYYGMMDLQGKLRLPVRFKNIDDFDSVGLAEAEDEKGNKGVINRLGQWLWQSQAPFKRLPNSHLVETGYEIDAATSEVKEPAEGLRYQTLGGQSMATPFIDKGIELVQGFDNQGYGLARKIDSDRRKMLSQEGFVNEHGEWLIPPEYGITLVSPLWESRQSAMEEYLEDQMSEYSLKSKVVLDRELSPQFNSQGLLIAAKNGKKGVIDRKGKVIVPFEYEEILLDTPFSRTGHRYIRATNRQGVWIYNNKGELTLRP